MLNEYTNSKLNAVDDLVASIIRQNAELYPQREGMRWSGIKPLSESCWMGQIFWKEGTVQWNDVIVMDDELGSPAKIESIVRTALSRNPPEHVNSANLRTGMTFDRVR